MSSPKCLHRARTWGDESCDFDTQDAANDNAKKAIIANNLSYFLSVEPEMQWPVSLWFNRTAVVKNADQSVSPSIIAFGTLRKAVPRCQNVKNLEVVLKCFFLTENEKYAAHVDGLMYENMVYSCMISNIIETPYFVFPYASFVKDLETDDKFEAKLAMAGRKYIGELDNADSPVRCKFIVTENCGAECLDDFATTCDDNTFLKLTLQMLAALEVLRVNQITHNDMHWHNVLVKQDAAGFWFDLVTGKVVRPTTPPTQQKTSLKSDGARLVPPDSIVWMDPGSQVKIFDWDRAVGVFADQPNLRAEGYGTHAHAYNDMYDIVGFIKTWARHVLWVREDSITMQRCRDVFFANYGELMAQNQWLTSGWHNTCKPYDTTEESDRNYITSDCDQKWSKVVMSDLLTAYHDFNQDIIGMLPAEAFFSI